MAQFALRSAVLRPPGSNRPRLWPADAVVPAGTLITMAADTLPTVAAVARPNPSGFRQVNLVSDIPGVTPLTDTVLVNARGLAASPGTDAAPAHRWAKRTGSRSSSMACGACTSVTGTPPRQANCSSPPDPMVGHAGCRGRSSRSAKATPGYRLSDQPHPQRRWRRWAGPAIDRRAIG
jgi:hypothetical protein